MKRILSLFLATSLLLSGSQTSQATPSLVNNTDREQETGTHLYYALGQQMLLTPATIRGLWSLTGITPPTQEPPTTPPVPEESPKEDALEEGILSPMEYRAMWISYLEFSRHDLSTKAKFLAVVEEMFQNCVDLGMNRVIVQVRPFGDALYPSQVYPWSHYISGTQGVAPDFDPLEEMILLAKEKNLKLEAWINPYRAGFSSWSSSLYSADNPLHNSELLLPNTEGIYYNPALPQVQEMVIEGVREIVENYDVDGIHLDDYFYPTTDLSVDYPQYEESGMTLSQEDWRRENVNTLVKGIYDTIQDVNPEVEFGISPQGNNSNNYNKQYSDVNLWLSTPGYVDYITPQLYWSYSYITSAGADRYQYETILDTWTSYERDPEIDLYIGLGAYRIGDGDNSAEDATLAEWNSGYNLTEMILTLMTGDQVNGYTLFRYDSLFHNTNYPELAQEEVNNMQELKELYNSD